MSDHPRFKQHPTSRLQARLTVLPSLYPFCIVALRGPSGGLGWVKPWRNSRTRICNLLRLPAATESGIRPQCFPLGSRKSRAAARSLLVAREANEEQLRFGFVCCGWKPVHLDWLADRLRANGPSLSNTNNTCPILCHNRGHVL